MKKNKKEKLNGDQPNFNGQVAKGAVVREPTREYAQQCSCCGGYKNVKNYSCIICRNWLKAKT